tara:strand:- start:19067 stop:19315 length:249 start_codon:yes stop_codon:yes gene_type:complete
VPKNIPHHAQKAFSNGTNEANFGLLGIVQKWRSSIVMQNSTEKAYKEKERERKRERERERERELYLAFCVHIFLGGKKGEYF